MSSANSAIGGYFDLDLPNHSDPKPAAFSLQSARAAIRAVVEAAGVRRVWIPSYICDSVVCAIEDAGAEPHFYLLTDRWLPDEESYTPDEEEAVLAVDYFGLIGPELNTWARENGDKWKLVILDFAQSFGAEPVEAAACVYSPRKFAGVPDGGYLFWHGYIEALEADDDGSYNRTRHLLKRAAEGAQAGYNDFRNAEQQLADTCPRTMSRLTERLVAAQDWAAIFRQRQNNFKYLHQRLSGCNGWEPLAVSRSPLIYPLMTPDARTIREQLIGKLIFVPRYWPECEHRDVWGKIEEQLLNQTVFIPVDQRMGKNELDCCLQHLLEMLAR